jgi:hypothetical protein
MRNPIRSKVNCVDSSAPQPARRNALACLPVLLALAACAAPPALIQTTGWSPALQQASQNYPPLILGANVHSDNGEIPLSCPKTGGRVEQRGGPTMEYFGADPSDPDLCVMQIGGQPAKAWYGIWVTDWASAAEGRAALRQIIHGHTGEIAGFDTVMLPGLQWHDFVRNEGTEDINLLGHVYHALKISHYREGYANNAYRSVSTIWKDLQTGLLIYGTYQHIAGAPEIDDPLGPTSITAGR